MSEMTVLPVRMMWGSADRMDAISTGEADLVFAGPPYFSDETEQFLIKPLSEQIEFDVVYNLLKGIQLLWQVAIKTLRASSSRDGYAIKLRT